MIIPTFSLFQVLKHGNRLEILCIIGLLIQITEQSKLHVIMANTTEEVYTSLSSAGPIYIVIFVFVIVAHIVIIYAISKRNRLAQKRYYIVASISACDCCGCLFILIRYIRSNIYGYVLKDITFSVFTGVIAASLRASLLCTCLLTFDRYIAVSLALRYHEVITNARIFKAISSFFVLSLLLLLVPYFGELKYDGVGMVAMNSILNLIISIFILSMAIYTIKIRRKHIMNMRSRSLQFGVEAEKLNLLESLKGSIHDVMRLNVLTVIFIFLTVIFALLTLSFDEEIFIKLRNITISLYIVSNPIVYISVLSELRAEIKKLFCGNNRINIERGDP